MLCYVGYSMHMVIPIDVGKWRRIISCTVSVSYMCFYITYYLLRKTCINIILQARDTLILNNMNIYIYYIIYYIIYIILYYIYNIIYHKYYIYILYIIYYIYIILIYYIMILIGFDQYTFKFGNMSNGQKPKAVLCTV